MSSTPLILGHRGASAVAPENTLAAFSRAISDGAEGIEFDVRLSRDGVPMVIHDASLKRTALVDRLVCDLTSEELQKIDIGSWFTPPSTQYSPSRARTHSDEKLRTLAQVFELFNSIDGLLYVEMKSDPREGAKLAKAVVKSIHEFGMANRVVVESFDLPSITEVKKMDSSIRTAALFEPKLWQPISAIRPQRMLNLARRADANEIALHHSLAGPGVVERARQGGLQTVLWTVDDPKWIQRACSWGIKALISNDPAKMVRHRHAAEHS